MLKSETRNGLGRILILGFAIFFAFIAFTHCGGGGGGGGGTQPALVVFEADVLAANGGTFSDSAVGPAITLTIPANGLQGDSRLTIERLTAPPGVGANQTSAGQAFRISLTGAGGGPAVVLADMELEMAANSAPAHPQRGEIAQLSGSNWESLDANFFRASTGSVISFTQQTSATFRAVLRSPRLATGPGVAAGLEVFLNETFGNENFFGPVIGLHTALNELTPNQAVSLGVQVDLAKVPQAIVDVMTGTNLPAKDAALNSFITTQQLIKAGAVIGVKGFYATTDPSDITMVSAGITCALCHVNVTPTQFELVTGPALLPIGPPEFDGVPNTQMDAGAILALTPFAQNAVPSPVALLNGWGKGAFDIRALPDNPLDDGEDNPTSNPPLWNFLDLQDLGYQLGWDGLFVNDGVNNNALASQAEAVYDLVMHGNGAFGTAGGNFPPELSVTPPQPLLDELQLAEDNDPGNVLDSQKMLDVQTWMQSIPSPAPGAVNEAEAEAGFRLFYGKAGCVACHSNPEIQGPGVFTNVQPATGDLAGGIHVPSLRGISRTAPYFHNQAAATLEDAVAHFVNAGLVPVLTAAEQAQIVEYLNGL